MRYVPVVFFLLSFTTLSALAQEDQNCSDILETEGRKAYEECIREERRERVDALLESQAESIDQERERVEQHVERQKQELDLHLRDAELSYDRAIDRLENQAEDLRRFDDEEDDERADVLDARIDDLETMKSLVSDALEQRKSLMDAVLDAHLERLELDRREYELRLRKSQLVLPY